MMPKRQCTWLHGKMQILVLGQDFSILSGVQGPCPEIC